MIRSTKLRVLWEVPLDQLRSISLEPTGIALDLNGGVGGPFVPITDASSRGFLFSHLEAVVRKFNAQTRSAEL